ncbi:MAG TPA: DUF1552 domain-containing protein [Polyangiaceae bacterium]|nr:DUF1552 domain-containing protein [Polyangiaceae bacterium]
MNRRAVLRSLLGVAAGVPLLRDLGDARAQEGTLQRLVLVYAPHGMARELWRPRDDFDIAYEGSSLQPFEPFKDRLLVLEGLDLSAGMEGGTSGHDGSRALFTGSAADGTNPSLDQYLAQELGQASPLSSLVLGIGDPSTKIGSCISYAQGGTPVAKLIDPTATFNQAFATFLQPADPAAVAALEAERQRGRSALDFLAADLESLRQRAPATERDKLDVHATSLRELEKRLAGFELACQLPSTPDAATFPKFLAYGGGEPYFEVVTELQTDLLAHALACGVTRFGSLMLADLSRTGLDPALPEDIHDDVAHRYLASEEPGESINGSPGDPSTWEPLARQNRHSHEQVARLLARLEELGALEGTLVVVSSDMGDPARHSSRRLPTLLAGGGGPIRLGRYLNVAEPGKRIPNNRLLVSIAQAFGLPVQSFGYALDQTIVSGTLDGL